MKKHKNLLTYFILSSFFAVKITLTAPYSFASNTTALYTNDTQYSPVVDTISLEELVDFALVESPVAAQEMMQTKIAEFTIDQAKGGWLPKVSLNSGADWLGEEDDINKSYGVTINQLLYDFGQTGYKIDAATRNLVATQYQQSISHKAIARQVADYYVEIKRYEQLIKAIDTNIESLKKLHSMALLRSNAGLTTQSDILQIESRMSSMQTLRIQYLANFDTFNTRIAILSGVAAKQYKPFPYEKFNLSSIQPINFSGLPEVLAAEASLDVARHDLKAAERAKLPTVNMTLAISREHINESSDWDKQVNINLSYPIYQGGILTAQVNQASANVSIARQDLRQIKLDIIQSSKVALRELENAKRLSHESSIQNKIAQRAKDVYQDEYLLGKRSVNDLLTVEQDLIQAIQSQINADFDSLLAAINYLSLSGELLNKLKS